MNQNREELLTNVNRAIIKMRGAYALWCRDNGINYHELLILYSLRDFGSCTQKQICEQYRLPKQTIHNVVSVLKDKGYVELKPGKENWREKVIVLTEAGRRYYSSVMDPLMAIEEEAVSRMGEKELRTMTELALRYGEILEEGLVNIQ